MPLFRVLLSTVIVMLAATGTAYSDVLKLEGDNEASVVIMDNRPTRGMTQTQVLDLFGEPVMRNDPVGQPPISIWNYNNFSVYFENNIVLHTVNHSKPKQSKAAE
jgi:outer membrane protein assembly factor BamE (lipoprotein component of BamABCDE complex)